ncbi:MAG: hypothetical protein KGY99_03275 [Phycisphaerae bacterium]|nr:hypothetical protein [Phycisphaerae bacterium]
MVEYRIISIGTLSRNRLWGESTAARTAHATTTLVRDGDRAILVDPSLPTAALEARFGERTGGRLADVTDVFCTTLRPVHRRALEALSDARWWTHETELETYRHHLEGLADSAGRLNPEQVRDVQADLTLLQRFEPAPDKLTEQVQLFPLAGASPGSAGLLLADPRMTVVVAGDAAVTSEHLLAGQVWDGVGDVSAAAGALRDLVEVADVVVCGHDNLTLLSQQWL